MFSLLLLLNLATTSNATILSPLIAHAQEIVIPQTVPDKIGFYAQKYGIRYEDLYDTIQGESFGSTTLQSYARYTIDHPEWGVKKGDRELSFGLCQIHLPAHPDISKAQANDPDFCLEWMAKQFSKGAVRDGACMWTVYALKHKECVIN